MQPGHRKHYAKFRLRCIKERCALVFCGGCGARPYHEGYTCDEWRRREEGLSCRCSRACVDRVFLFSLRDGSGCAIQRFVETSKKLERGLPAARNSKLHRKPALRPRMLWLYRREHQVDHHVCLLGVVWIVP